MSGIPEGYVTSKTKQKLLAKSEDFLKRVQCRLCKVIVSPEAVYCRSEKCHFVFCKSCNDRFNFSPCGCKSPFLVPIKDLDGENEVIEHQFWVVFKELTFKCICSPRSKNTEKCKHEIDYEELYRLGKHKGRVGLSHRCEKLPLKCKRCNELVTEDKKLPHYFNC